MHDHHTGANKPFWDAVNDRDPEKGRESLKAQFKDAASQEAVMSFAMKEADRVSAPNTDPKDREQVELMLKQVSGALGISIQMPGGGKPGFSISVRETSSQNGKTPLLLSDRTAIDASNGAKFYMAQDSLVGNYAALRAAGAEGHPPALRFDAPGAASAGSRAQAVYTVGRSSEGEPAFQRIDQGVVAQSASPSGKSGTANPLRHLRLPQWLPPRVTPPRRHRPQFRVRLRYLKNSTWR